ncbi:MAG TPA: glycosyltransferase family 9 protein [Bacteroidales bacterium]|nr:glycosyltransferase family 9 protein [Bacteroidales bacterium]
MNNHPKILIIRLSSIGDIVLTTPILRCIKEQIPNAKIHYLVKANNSIILSNNPYVDKTIYFSNSLSEIIKELKKEKYDYVFDLHNQVRSLIIRLRLNRPSKVFNPIRFRKWLLVKWKINKMPKKHIVDRYFEVLVGLGIKNDNKGLDYFLSEEDYISPDALPLSFQEGYIAVVVGSKHNTKQMPTDMLIELCEGIDKPIVLLGDKDDRKKAITIENTVGAKVFNACGAYNLNQTSSLIKNSYGVITPDTGLMHISAALNQNIISVWGNTVPEFGMYPYMPKESKAEVHILEDKDLDCRPCHKHGHSKCPKKHFKCMRNLDVDKMIEIANSWTAGKNI